MLNDVYKGYRRSADLVEWKKYNCNDLFYEYIKHENDELKDNFYAGIVCRYWGYSARVYTKCNKHVPFEQCYDVLIDTINYVLNKRVWEDPSSSLYGDHAAPDKAFHMVLKRQTSVLLSNLTAYKRKTNFNTLSIDGAHEEYNDAAEGLLFDDNLSTSEESRDMYIYISEYFGKKEYLKGLMLDLICFSSYNSFTYQGIISLLKELGSEEFDKYYSLVYGLDKKLYNKTLREVYETSNRLLIIKLKRLLHEMKGDY